MERLAYKKGKTPQGLRHYNTIAMDNNAEEMPTVQILKLLDLPLAHKNVEFSQ